MHSHSSSWLHTQYPRDLLNGHGVNLNLNQDVNKLRQLPFQREDAVAVGLNDVDSQNVNPSETASNVNVRNSKSISINDGSEFSHITRPKSTTPSVRKLRKKPPGRDDYESVGGYMSEKNAKRKEKSGDGMDASMKKKKSFIQVINKISNDVQSPSQGYETDGGAVLSSQKSKKVKKKSKTKNPSKETGYDTDGGYQSENRKSKTRFFKLPTKSSKPNFHVTANGPIPALPNSLEKKMESVVPLPIAGRFARTLSFSMPSPTTTESAETHVDNSFPQISLKPFPATFDFTSTTSSPVSAGPSSTFDRAQIAPTSDSPSAFNAYLHPKNRDSRFSFVSSSSSSGSGSNQHSKLQNLKGLFSPLHSPPSSMQGHQQHGLRPSVSLSSLKHPKPVISFPITRDSSPTSTDLPFSTRSLQSLSVSPTSTSFRSSVSSLQFKKPFRIKLHHPELPTQQPSPAQTAVSSPTGSGSPSVFLTPTLPLLQIPRFTKVRPKNPPTDGFGPRSPLTPDSAALGSTLRPSPISSPLRSPGSSPTDNSGLSPNPPIQASSKRSSQQTIIPSSDYIVPSPRNSPLKTQNPGLPGSPTVLTTYHHYDHIPPQPSPAPKGPLPTPPSSSESGESPAAAGNNSSSGSGSSNSGSGAGQQLPSLAVHLRQRMSKMNMRQSLLPSQSTPVAIPPVSVGGGSGEVEKSGVVGLRVEKKSGIIRPSVDDIPTKFQKGKAKKARLSKFAAAADNRQSWIDIGDDTSLDKKETTLDVEDEDQQEVEEEPEDLYEILDRFENRDKDIHHHSSSSEQALERSHSFKAGKLAKEKRSYPDNNSFNSARPPRHHQHVPAAVVVPDLYGFEDDGKSLGDRTSRWSESVYSRSSSISILGEEESEERRDRFVKRVEAMLDAEKKARAKDYIPPLPEIPHAYANIIHKPNGNINENAGHHSNITPGRSWNKF